MRDTQFAGFAKALWDELPDVPDNHYEATSYDKWSEACEQIIAQRAYDLSQHAVGYALEYLHECGLRTPGSMDLSIQPTIPDLAELPEVSE